MITPNKNCTLFSDSGIFCQHYTTLYLQNEQIPPAEGGAPPLRDLLMMRLLVVADHILDFSLIIVPPPGFALPFFPISPSPPPPTFIASRASCTTQQFCLSNNSRATFRVGFLLSWGITSRNKKKRVNIWHWWWERLFSKQLGCFAAGFYSQFQLN